MLSAETTINAPPHVVREVFLDFERIPTWHNQRPFFESIQVTGPSRLNGSECQKGDKMAVKIPGMNFTPTVQENEPENFRWLGSLPYILTGPHDFFFRPDPSGDANKTLFRQEENFTGLLSFMFDNPNSTRGKGTIEGWQRFNEDIKKEAERVWADKQGAVA
ncbi:hypothetical protein BD324DRAFT_616684 [Kockovaella imperatae]|uniref:SRPBCC domain-containing protein n=1 Tax=Kockovaella imperatae TaxID=4999 RepID=A0A1Y1UQA3_9TREE|nr:hypothetical protein BD324DRAFT_616684 [Kockovaella imperatae]ORX40179.1 hypothetical protein BD324DRAFT_616684 [Kockovaella imperatae]